jgi:hypothetical protein
MAGEIRLEFSEQSKQSIAQINASLVDVFAVVTEINKTKLNFAEGAEKAAKSIKDLSEEEKRLIAIEKEKERVNNQLIQQEAKLTIAQSDQGKELVKLRSEISSTNRELKRLKLLMVRLA